MKPLETILERRLIINANAHETRIALLENNKVSELFIERISDKVVIGNIYKGVVTRVLPGMNAAFINIGLSRAAFLFGGDAIHADDAYLMQELSDDEVFEQRTNKRPIEHILKEGQEIVVQISKEPLGSKGPRVTMHLTLSGRYVVFMPNTPHVGVSKKIVSEVERARLKSVVSEMLPPGTGAILRTASENLPEEILKRDIVYLLRAYKQAEHNIHHCRPPSLVHTEIDLAKKISRDLYDEKMDKIIIDDRFLYNELYEYLSIALPQAVKALTLHLDLIPLFDIYGVEIDIARALSRRVELPSGGYLVIDQTEALTTFDINTGKFVGKISARQTILDTNLEAARIVVEQLRIRNIGGIIIVDFIDLEDPVDQEILFLNFQEELKRDRAKNNVLRISELGLVQMTRKRTSDSLERILMSHCPMCEGRGKIKSVQTEALDLLHEIMRTHGLTKKTDFEIMIRTDVYDYIQKKLIDRLEEVKKEFNLKIDFKIGKLNLHILREPAFELFIL